MSFCPLGADGSPPTGLSPACLTTRLRLLGIAVSGEMYSWHADLGLPKKTFSQNCVLLMAQPRSLLASIEWDLLALSFPEQRVGAARWRLPWGKGWLLTLQKANNTRQAPRSRGKCGVSRQRFGWGHSTSWALLFTCNNCMESPPPALPDGCESHAHHRALEQSSLENFSFKSTI